MKRAFTRQVGQGSQAARFRFLGALLLALVSAADAAAGEAAPRLELDGERRLVLAVLPPILAEDEVKQHLTSGLTTSIYFLPGVRPKRGRRDAAGGARVDVRYDLWDEVFDVTVLGRGERIGRTRHRSFEDLLEWWRGLELVLLDGDRLEEPWPRRLKVSADVVPFSAAEQDDARRWFSESIEAGRRSGSREVGRSGDESAETLSRTFNLLLATSIRRRALTSFSWVVPLPPQPEDPP